MEILPSARKHGISDDDVRHGFDNAVAAITTPDQPDFTMIVGADLNGSSWRSASSPLTTTTT